MSDFSPSGGSVVCKTSEGLEFRATVTRLTRHQVVFEVYNPTVVLRLSESLANFNISFNDRPVYSGRAVVSNLMHTGTTQVCEVALDDQWHESDLPSAPDGPKGLRSKVDVFFSTWQKLYRILPGFKLAVADLHTFLTDLRLWLERIEMDIRSAPSGDRIKMESDAANELSGSIAPILSNLFEKFEVAAADVESDFRAAHRIFSRRILHPLLLCSPFLHRTFSKPLGYAGDYEMVNMILRDPCEGGSLFAKVVNFWFLLQAPAQAHRNRIDYLVRMLEEATLRAIADGRRARVLNLGCGPAQEVQRFIAETSYANHASFVLLDFNEDTLAYTRNILETAQQQHHRSCEISLVKKSVNQILKEASRSVERRDPSKYDLVYCAGLFDYLNDELCRRLTDILHGSVAPGGLFVTTNVADSNPRRITMDYIMEWNLIYRNARQMAALKPPRIEEGNYVIESDSTGVNVFFRARGY
jgi:extracellular factor (EF) 3-hydroxypalmitic acid methyl ester biosynthesis protein